MKRQGLHSLLKLRRCTPKELAYLYTTANIAYDTRVHLSINQTPFSLVLSQQLLNTTLLYAGNVVSTDACDEASLQLLCLTIKASMCTLRAKVDAHSMKWQHRFKQDYDCRLLEASPLKLHGLILVATPSLTATKGNDASSLEIGAHNKLIGRMVRPFRVVREQLHIVNTKKMVYPLQIPSIVCCTPQLWQHLPLSRSRVRRAREHKRYLQWMYRRLCLVEDISQIPHPQMSTSILSTA